MSIPLSKIPYRVLEALKGREYSDTQIEQMSAFVTVVPVSLIGGLLGGYFASSRNC